MKFEDLTEENNFWKLYALTRKIPDSKDNVLIFIVSYIIFFSYNYDGLKIEVDEFDRVKDALKLLLSTLLSIMGFILAGYAIFATLTDKELQHELADHIEPTTKLNYLKYSHCIFIRILVDLLLIAFLSLLFFAFLEMANGISFEIEVLISIIEPLVYALMVLILMLCKSFIYNVYHSIMTSMRWYSENNQ
ncbi:hypothetical protein [Bowmanella denitrificans]|uniref:hypothetical protein n=1 Tax=Bowmanella denitrificans TaxID=366582 RepID=UPI000C9C503E|nr:hypothetical protein [Bowmanella denitrificans]